jgi:hypothetical protein
MFPRTPLERLQEVAMGVTYSEAENALSEAVAQIYRNNVRVRAVGIGRNGNGYGFVAIRNMARIVPSSTTIGLPFTDIRNVPVIYLDRQEDPLPDLRLPATGPGSPAVASLVPEQRQHNPLICGLQIENFDDDDRTGTIAAGHISIGTLGCFVTLNGGQTAILSNNHVIAGHNRGVRGADRIMHPGTGVFTAADHTATLTDYVDLQPSPLGAMPALGGIVWNDVDAGVAVLQSGVACRQEYLPSRALASPSGTRTAVPGDQVYKVGRTTGLTRGIVNITGSVVGPVLYAPGQCWFRNSIIINGFGGTLFSDRGDSGSMVFPLCQSIVRQSDSTTICGACHLHDLSRFPYLAAPLPGSRLRGSQ